MYRSATESCKSFTPGSRGLKGLLQALCACLTFCAITEAIRGTSCPRVSGVNICRRYGAHVARLDQQHAYVHQNQIDVDKHH
eukprot:1029643-Prymnesium_polylepis.1